MGVEQNIRWDKFPRQSYRLHQRVDVIFNYDSENIIRGTVVRADATHPWKMIFRLDDGRYILSTECQYSYAPRGIEMVEVWQ